MIQVPVSYVYIKVLLSFSEEKLQCSILTDILFTNNYEDLDKMIRFLCKKKLTGSNFVSFII